MRVLIYFIWISDLCSFQEAYQRWVCSQLFVFYDGEGCPVQPCASICHCVEQKCPYLLPQQKPVAGEPSFLCEGKNAMMNIKSLFSRVNSISIADPSIRLSGVSSSAPNDPLRCYEPCSPTESLGGLHQNVNETELALCVHSRAKLPPDCAYGAGPQCLGSPCGCARMSVPILTICECLLLLFVVSRTLFLRPRGFI